MGEVRERIEQAGKFFAENAAANEELGRLTDEVADKIRWTGAARMLQPVEFGGYEAHPVEFMEALMELGTYSGAAGWVAGVVGVHPWEIGQVDHSVQEAIWGEDPDTWIASPYAPMGRARPEGDGWVLSGRWSFSSGTDHCRWAVLGGLLTDANGDVMRNGNPGRHFILPRSDYTIVEDSWDVIGLEGTGSKDVIVDGAFLPKERVVELEKLPETAPSLGRTATLYKMPFSTMFSGIIAAGTLGLACGALEAFVDYARDRIDHAGSAAVTNPHLLAVLGAASADVAASRLQFLNDINRVYDLVDSGAEASAALRLEVRRNQVGAVRRAVDAIDALFLHAGGSSLRRDQPFQRFWRDLHAAANHASNTAEPTYEGYGLHLFGQPIPPSIKF